MLIQDMPTGKWIETDKSIFLCYSCNRTFGHTHIVQAPRNEETMTREYFCKRCNDILATQWEKGN